MSRQVSVESAKASVTVDVDGGPSSVPQELQEACKIPFLPFLLENTYPESQLSVYPPFLRLRRTPQNSQKLLGTSPS